MRPRGGDAFEATALFALLPTSAQTRFLRACVHTGATARDAWSYWSAEATRDGTSLVDALEPFARFLPLLSWNLARARVLVDDPGLRAHLQAARQAAAHRWLTYRVEAQAAFGTLQAAGIAFIVLKGAALSGTVYPSPAFRPKADIDVWLHPDDLDRAAALLRDHGWQQMPAVGLQNPQHLPALVRADGPPVELHRWLLLPYYALPTDDLWARSVPTTLADVQTRVLSDADALVHAVGHAMSGYGLAMLPWVVDAHFILDQSVAMDWPRIVDMARSANLGPAVYTALRYLAEDMRMDIPPTVVDALQETATRSHVRGRAAARLAVRPWPEGGLGPIWRTRGSWWRRAALVCQRLFPPPLELALRYDVPLWSVPLYYLVRIARYARAPER